MIEILRVPRLAVRTFSVVVLVADVMDLLQGAMFGQLIKTASSKQRVDVLAVLEILPNDLKIFFKIGIIDVQVAPTPLFSFLLNGHFSDSLQPRHFISLGVEVLD